MIDAALEAAIRSSWSETTASGDDPWSDDNPSAGHCDVTALVVREHLGGDLVQVEVHRDGEHSEYHYWNLLPDGSEVDLTREQFDGTETFRERTVLDEAFFASRGPVRPPLADRLDRFRRSVDQHLAATRARSGSPGDRGRRRRSGPAAG